VIVRDFLLMLVGSGATHCTGYFHGWIGYDVYYILLVGWSSMPGMGIFIYHWRGYHTGTLTKDSLVTIPVH